MKLNILLHPTSKLSFFIKKPCFTEVMAQMEHKPPLSLAQAWLRRAGVQPIRVLRQVLLS